MIDINPKPSENPPFPIPSEEPESQIEPEIEESRTLIVAPPSLRERIQAAQRARMLQIQPSIEAPDSDTAQEVDQANPQADA